ncbi:MAG: Ig-like domain-containing protein [Roseburia sp.]|nr:Ig-like domain-containing protein [Roseburia sp.]
MKKNNKIILVIFALIAVSFVCSRPVHAATVDVPVANYGSVDMELITGDDGYIRPAVENLVDYAGMPITVSTWNYYVSGSDVLSVGNDGYYKALTAGSAWVQITGYDNMGSTVFSASCDVTVSVNMTNVTLEKDTLHGYLCGFQSFEGKIKILDPDQVIDSYTQVSVTSSNTKMMVTGQIEDHVLYVSCYSAGSTVLTIDINGKTFQVNLKIDKLEITKRSIVTSKGKKTTLRVKGTTDKPVWSSSNTKVAKVSSNGTVRFRKMGNAVITADFSGNKVGCAVSVVSPGLLKVVKRARMIGSTWKYSQPKRMQKGYYDCSSLVWKCYSQIGKKFGLANYAPVAADLAKWCKSHGKVLTKSYTRAHIQKMKFRPGDLMFETGANNNRYKGIYHVEMFTGYAVSYYDESGKPVLNELWAARPEGYYGGGGLMERP